MDSPSEEQLSLPPPTAPETIPITFKGFADDVSISAFADDLGDVVRCISMWVNLERLDGITVAFDYNEALASLERGFQATIPLTPTSGNEIVGVAMTPAVLRDGIVKAHMVFYAPVVLPFRKKDKSPDYLRALYLIAHECGHVEELKHRDEAFPHTLLQSQFHDVGDALLGKTAEPLWQEYAACRASARFGPEQTAILEESLVSVLKVARSQCYAAIRKYRLHADVNRVLVEAGGPLCEPLRLTSYLIGHLDGLGLELENVSLTKDLLDASLYGKFVTPLRNALRDLWADKGRWQSPQVFDPLKDIVRNVLGDVGMILSRPEGGQLHVVIPFTPETMP